jgi:hypothetical protein
MKKIIVLIILISQFSVVFSQIKTATIEATHKLTVDEAFIWQGDTIRKDSIVYAELKPDSVRFKYINGSWSDWFLSTDFGIGDLTENYLPIKGSIDLIDSKISEVGTETNINNNLQVEGDIKAKERVVITKNAQSPEYYSGFLGSGWYLGGDSAMAVVDYLTVRKTMKVYELLISKIRAINGGLVISAANAKIDSVYQSSSSYQIFPDDTTISFVQYDIARCDVFTGYGKKYYSALVDSLSSISQSFWLKVIDGTDEPEAGDEIVQFGNTTNTDRQGLLYLTATDDNSPYIDVLDGVNSTDYSGCTKVRLGDLSGVSTSTWGTLSGYGLTSENAYLENANISGTITVTGGNAATQTYADGVASTAQTNATNYTDTEIGDINISANGTLNNAGGGQVTIGGLGYTGDLNATVGATWGTNLNSIPSYLQSTAPDNSLSITNNFLGFHATGSNWPVRIANDAGTGKFYAGNGSTQYVDWNGSTLSIAGNINITGGNAATQTYAAGVASTAESNAISTAASDATTKANTAQTNATNYTDTEIGDITIDADGTLNNAGGGQVTIGGLGYTGDLNATVGATWGTNLYSIPSTLGTPSGTGLFLSSSALGYYTGGTWTTYIDNSGNMILGDYAGDDTGLYWNQGTGVLGIKGTIRAESGFFGNTTTGWNIGSSYLYNDSYTTGLAPSDYPFYAGSTFSNRASAPFKVTSAGAMTATDATITGTINLPPTWGGQSGYIDNSGIHMAYSGGSYQSIEWYNYLGTYAGQIYPNSSGYLNFDSSFGVNINSNATAASPVNIGASGISGDITIGNTLRAVDFNGSDVSNVSVLNLGGYGTIAATSATNYLIDVESSLIIFTSITSGAAVYKIEVNGTTPTNGDIVWFVNATSTDIDFRAPSEVAGSNILGQNGNGHTRLLDKSTLCLIYYSGYWRPSVDFGQ